MKHPDKTTEELARDIRWKSFDIHKFGIYFDEDPRNAIAEKLFAHLIENSEYTRTIDLEGVHSGISPNKLQLHKYLRYWRTRWMLEQQLKWFRKDLLSNTKIFTKYVRGLMVDKLIEIRRENPDKGEPVVDLDSTEINLLVKSFLHYVSIPEIDCGIKYKNVPSFLMWVHPAEKKMVLEHRKQGK